MKKKVAIQGIAGSYHDIAARNYFEGEEIEIIGCNTFDHQERSFHSGNDGDRKYNCRQLVAEP